MKLSHTILFKDIKQRNQGIDGRRVARELRSAAVSLINDKEIFRSEYPLLRAFVWGLTPQGLDFWEHLDDGKGFPK